MLRDADGRPTSTLRSRSGTSPGSPADGMGSSAFCTAYQSGSIQISATHESSPSGAGVGKAAGASTAGVGVLTGAGAAIGAGAVPVVKS